MSNDTEKHASHIYQTEPSLIASPSWGHGYNFAPLSDSIDKRVTVMVLQPLFVFLSAHVIQIHIYIVLCVESYSV